MTHRITAMRDAPRRRQKVRRKTKVAECTAACFQCALTCTSCADACLAKAMVADVVRCIRTDLDCADICAAAGTVLTAGMGMGMMLFTINGKEFNEARTETPVATGNVEE